MSDKTEPRFTFALNPEGQLEICLNETARDVLIQELENLNEEWDHIQIGTEETSADIVTSEVPYREDQRVVQFGKILFRPDDWDIENYPHTIKPKS